MPTYIYERPEWPAFTYDLAVLSPLLREIGLKQGRFLGQLDRLGFEVGLSSQATLQTLTLDVLKTSEIEGEQLNADQVRSSVARRLGLEFAGLIPSSPAVDGVVEMLLDAIQSYKQPLTQEQLFVWHQALFSTGVSGLTKIRTGAWRQDTNGPMEVISGPFGQEKVHFQAPAAKKLAKEMKAFLAWFNDEQPHLDLVLKAGIAHLWFVTLHPFEDGNGRLTRAITDRALSRAENSPKRFYSMSAQICQERNAYYAILEKTQKGPLDITPWLTWFLECLGRAIDSTEGTLETILTKTRFWDKAKAHALNERQNKVLNRLLEGFEGKLTSSKWAKLGNCSQDTAKRDIDSLISTELLKKAASGGRSTHYLLDL